MSDYRSRVLIIGSGAAGYTAAIYAARAGLDPIVVQGMEPGGQLTTTTDVENYPGFADVIQGPWLMEQMRKQAEHVGARLVFDSIAAVDFSKRPFTCAGDSGDRYVAETVIIATGASAKWLGLESEQKFRNFGVSACATCDGFFFKGKDVLVVGGGNTAVEEAIYLSNIARQVTVIHRRDAFRAEKILQERLFKIKNVEVLWYTELEEVLGADNPPGVTGVRLKNKQTGEISERKLDGVFIAIGHQPNTALFGDWLEADKHGYLVTAADSTKTNIPGVYAAGDVQDSVYRQAVTAAGTGCMAALEAERFLSQQEG